MGNLYSCSSFKKDKKNEEEKEYMIFQILKNFIINIHVKYILVI